MTPRERNLSYIGLVALRHNLTRQDILGYSRTAKVSMARQDCAAFFRERGYSTVEIGRIMKRDHSTILHALKQHRARTNEGVPGASMGLI